MRLVPVLALMTSALALAACGGGGGGFGSSVLGARGVSEGVATNCGITPVDNITDTNCGVEPEPDPNAIVDADGDGIDDNEDADGDGDPDDDDGDTGSGAGGNTTGLTTGNRSIVLAKNVMDKPKTAKAALSTLSGVNADGTLATLAATTEAILGNKKPTKLMIQTDTKSAKNGQLSVAELQSHYIEGSRDLFWIWLGHSTVRAARPANNTATFWDDAVAIATSTVDKNGNPLRVDTNSGEFVYTVSDPNGAFDAGDNIDYNDDAIWNQISSFMTAKVNGGSGTGFREYRLRSSDEENYRDESLQVWAWGDSYATQYRNGASNGEPKHEIWSFGGRAAQNVLTGGKAKYNGRYVGTAKTSNWDPPEGAEINPNVLWRVQGKVVVDANFDTSKITGKISTDTWTSIQSVSPTYTWHTNTSDTPSVSTGVAPEYYFYKTKLNIAGDLVSDGTVGGVKNQINGNVSMDRGFITGDNSLLGGLFGTNGEEMTGVFHANGGVPFPIGGSTGNTDGREGVLIINGAFNANCAQKPDGTCVTTP